MRFVAAVIIIVASIIAGLKISARYKERIDILNEFKMFINYAENNIEFSQKKTTEILNDFDFKTDFFNSFKFETPKLINSRAVKNNELELMKSFFDGFGLTDTKGQLKRCNLYEKNIDVCIKEAEKDYSSAGKMAIKLSAAFGIMLAIIII